MQTSACIAKISTKVAELLFHVHRVDM